MMKVTNGYAFNGGTVFKNDGEVPLDVNGMIIDQCDTVFDLKDNGQQLDIKTKRMHVTNANTHLKVDSSEGHQKSSSTKDECDFEIAAKIATELLYQRGYFKR